jgi:hypothetical protein
VPGSPIPPGEIEKELRKRLRNTDFSLCLKPEGEF